MLLDLLTGSTTRPGVRASHELTRVLALPTDPAPELNWAALEPAGWALRPAQRAMLAEASRSRGLLASAGVGTGKTLVTYLLPRVLEATRPVLLVPASLARKTELEFDELAAAGWDGGPRPEVISYERLSRLPDLPDADLVIADEAHALKSRKSARTRKFLRWAKGHPDAVFCALTGSLCHRSLHDFAHLARVALGDGTPLPRTWPVLSEWAAAIDPKVPPLERLSPGALSVFGADLEAVRVGLRTRIAQTPGVVATEVQAYDGPLSISVRRTRLPPDLLAAVREVYKSWRLPDGTELEEPVDVWRHAQTMALGFWYELDPPPPAPWLEARAAWARYVREVLGSNRRGLDSPAMVEAEAEARGLEVLARWAEVRGTFKPRRRARWLDSGAYLRELCQTDRDLVWISHPAAGARCGIPYAGAGVEPEHGTHGAASVKAHGTGKNLQAYASALVISPWPSAALWQQVIGRMHRPGQTRPVEIEIVCSFPGARKAMREALEVARGLEALTGDPHKLLALDPDSI